jgi:methylisocitrate lyase
MVLYPLSAFRAMNRAASNAYSTIREQGTQKNILDQMQTRKELYESLDYYRYEQLADQ